MTDLLSQLKEHSLIVADTGDFASIVKYQPRDSTTNPSLILKAVELPQYKSLVDKVLSECVKKDGNSDHVLAQVMDQLNVAFGIEILKIVPGRVSTETDARLSFDTAGILEKSRALIALYEKAGISRERILIKIAATWEGIASAGLLRKEGINCNLTLLFSRAQAIACAEAGVQLISPFVGRILDWYKKSTGKSAYEPAEDPGVVSVMEIYNYYKTFGYKTEVMGASFRNKEEILELAGCDLLTISPALLEELQQGQGTLVRKLSPEKAGQCKFTKVSYDEKGFRWALNENQMATEKLSEGIRLFAADSVKLEQLLIKKIQELDPGMSKGWTSNGPHAEKGEKIGA